MPVLVKDPDKMKNRDPFNVAVGEMQKQILSVAEDAKTGVITVAAEYTDPRLAQRIASSAVSILGEVLNEKALTVSRKSSQLLEQQISEQEKKLSDLQVQMASFQKETKIISPEGQMTSAMTLYSSLLGQKIALQVQLSRYENALSTDNPLVGSLRAQLDEIEKQIGNIESFTNRWVRFQSAMRPNNWWSIRISTAISILRLSITQAYWRHMKTRSYPKHRISFMSR